VIVGVFKALLPWNCNINFHKISFFNARGLKLCHFDIFAIVFPFLAFFKSAHNFMKSQSRDGIASKGPLVVMIPTSFIFKSVLFLLIMNP